MEHFTTQLFKGPVESNFIIQFKLIMKFQHLLFVLTFILSIIIEAQAGFDEEKHPPDYNPYYDYYECKCKCAQTGIYCIYNCGPLYCYKNCKKKVRNCYKKCCYNYAYPDNEDVCYW